jgi:hypothetical protein
MVDEPQGRRGSHWMRNKYTWPLIGSALIAVAFAVLIWVFAS